MLTSKPLVINDQASGINENLRKPIGTAYVAALSDQKSMATLLSVQSQLKALLAAIFAPLIGILADSFGIGNALIIFGVAVMVLSPFYWVRRVKEGVLGGGDENLFTLAKPQYIIASHF